MSSVGPKQDAEIAELIKGRGLVFPIVCKRDFIAQMTKSGEAICFRGVTYDPSFAAGLVPDFFFPVTCEQDMLEKAVDLITARGLSSMRRDP
jgi:hypothetical protein